MSDLPRATPAHTSGKTWTLVAVCIATFMLMLDLTVVNVALPDIRAALDATFTDLQWVLDAYALGLAVFVLGSGALADQFGRKRVFNIGFVAFLFASLACGIAQTPEALIVARGVQGLAGAMLFAIGPALIGHAFRGKERGFAFGVFGGVAGMAIAFGPLLGGMLTEQFSWRWIFLINVPLGIIGIIMSTTRMVESRDPRARQVDWAGLLTFSAGVTLLVAGFLRGEGQGWASLQILTMFAAALVLFAVFVVIEIRLGERALLDLSLFRNRTMTGLSIVTFICGGATMAALFLLISYVQNVLGLSAWETGVRFLPLTLALCIAAVVGGNLTTILAPRLLVGSSMAAIAIGLYLVTLLKVDSSWTALLPSMLMIGLGMGLFNPPRAAFSIAVAEPSRAGMASGINETFQQVGVALGIAAFGALFQGRVQHGFLESAAASTLGDGAGVVADSVAAGGFQEVAQALPLDIQAAVVLAARESLLAGLQDVMIVCGIFALLGAVIAFTTLRRQDLREDTADSAGPVDPDMLTGPAGSDERHRAQWMRKTRA